MKKKFLVKHLIKFNIFTKVFLIFIYIIYYAIFSYYFIKNIGFYNIFLIL